MCNLACKYCFVEKGENTLSTEELDKILYKLISQNKNDFLFLQYFGGEPTLKNDCLLQAYSLNRIKGFKEINDKKRITKNGEGTFDVINIK